MKVETFPLGDSAVYVKFKDEVSPDLNRRIRLFCEMLGQANYDGVIEWVPAYETVTVYYSPLAIHFQNLSDKIIRLAESIGDAKATGSSYSSLIYLPTLYGGEYGEDLSKVAEANDLSDEDVIALHSGSDYLVYMIGFLPGFPYLGGMSAKIATPRLKTPRPRVPAGAVGIAGEQTGVYPLESPGGWNLIGRTPVKLFDMEREEPFLFQAGDKIRFVPVTLDEYEQVEAKVEAGSFEVRREKINEDACD